ncbi:hypothetical protein BJ944DRAFT_274188 [Cunninghamella echinulata]|nr:hypothetical protein BJ944DRAFT_274188 [Cunninghamella echinulata]
MTTATEYNPMMEEEYHYSNEAIQIMQQRELNDFEEYDQAMYNAMYYTDDYSYHDGDYMEDDEEEEQQNDYNDDDMMLWDDNNNEEYEEEQHDDSALLRLIVDVQMYLSESPSLNKKDTPLLDLQYKMYTYMKQKAIELGVDTSNLY